MTPAPLSLFHGATAPRVAFAFKDVSKIACHVGLGVTALNLAASFMDAGIAAETWPVFDGYVLRDKLKQRPDITHVVMLAPWVDTPFLAGLTAMFPRVRFTVTCHSNVGFLQCDGWSMKVIREQMDLERDRMNFHVSGNSKAYCDFVRAAYSRPCALLPNMHHMQTAPKFKAPWKRGTPLRIGIFGATRVLKNMGTAVAGALVAAEKLQAETEIWVSAGREEGGKGIMAAVTAMVDRHPYARLVQSPWQTWPQFHGTVRRMNLLLQPSFTESFNNVTADGITQGVPSVVSPAIDWVPSDWQADPDDAVEIGNAALHIVAKRRAPAQGLKSLNNYNAAALKLWRKYLAA
jgi:hypothetical protein